MSPGGDLPVAGRTIVITGGAGGIGAALGVAFAGRGARVVLADLEAAEPGERAAELSKAGLDVTGAVLDVTDPEACERLVARAAERAGPGGLAGVLANAGIGCPPASVARTPLADARRVMEVNYWGAWNMAAAALPLLSEQAERSAFWVTGSENSFFNAARGMGAYIASKHAVRGLAEALREEVRDQVSVGLVVPGLVATGLTAGPLEEAAMPAAEFARRAVPQMLSGAFHIVTHPYNIERIRPVHAEIEAAFDARAPRESGDERWDVRQLIEGLGRGS